MSNYHVLLITNFEEQFRFEQCDNGAFRSATQCYAKACEQNGYGRNNSMRRTAAENNNQWHCIARVYLHPVLQQSVK